MSKKIKLISLIVVILIVGIISLFLCLNNKNKLIIPNNYISIFNGKLNGVMYSTYIYKIDNNQSNYGFEYINVRVINNKKEIVNQGEVEWTDNVFKVAKDNNAYEYVVLPNSDKKYSIEEYMGMFLMN